MSKRKNSQTNKNYFFSILNESTLIWHITWKIEFTAQNTLLHETFYTRKHCCFHFLSILWMWLQYSTISLFPLSLRPMVRWSWAHSVKVTSCSRCLLCWSERALEACCWDPLRPGKETPPPLRWFTTGEIRLWRNWRPPWLNDYAPSTSPPESEDNVTPAEDRRQK